MKASIVIELANVEHGARSRLARMLDRLRSEIEELPPAAGDVIEVVFAYDASSVDQADLLRVVSERDLGVPVRFQATPGAGYYELKNAGARTAAGELVVFVDSDVVPEPGWLRELASAFEPGVEVVCGGAYVEPTGLWSKSFALGHYGNFPLREPDGPPRAVSGFYANNLAFRAATARRFPFPVLPGTGRGSCVRLAETLRAAGTGIVLNPRARVAHPAPAPIREALVRAVAEGRDHVILTGSRPRTAAFASRISLARDRLRTVVSERRRVGLPALGVPAALAIVGTYWAIALVAAALTRVDRRLTAWARI